MMSEWGSGVTSYVAMHYCDSLKYVDVWWVVHRLFLAARSSGMPKDTCVEGSKKTIRGGWMWDNQNFLSEFGLYLVTDPTPLSSNSDKTAQIQTSYRPSEPGYEPQRKYRTVLARLRARSTTKIRSKNSLYPHIYFTEELVAAFEKSPQESQEPSSLFIWWLKNHTGDHLQ
jgi:hypothetical protein